MKSLSKISITDLFSNPITRNLILILATTFGFAVAIVTLSIIIYNQL